MDINTSKFDNMKVYVTKNLIYYGNNPVDVILGNKNFDEFPIINKIILRDKYNEFISKNTDYKNVVTEYTSGSTGVPLRLLKSKEEINRLTISLYQQRCRVIPKGFSKFVQIKFYGAIKDNGEYIMKKVLKEKETINLSMLHMDNESLSEYCNVLKNDIENGWIMGAPSIVEKLSDFILINEIKINSIQYIELTGELCFPLQKQKIKNAFNCPVRNHYGNREFWGIAFECEFGKLHILDKHVYVETINNEIIVSTLDQFTMPLVRYNIGDVGNICNDVCECRQNSKILELHGEKLPTIYILHVEKLLALWWYILL